MKNFDKERFVQLLKYDVVSNWRNHVSFAIGAFLAHFAAQFGMIYFSVKNMYNSLPERAGNICRDAASISFVVSYIVFSVALSLMFVNLKTKPKRIAYLMLPATNVEKFLSRFLLFTLGAGVVNFVAFVFADLLRMLALSGMWVRVNSAVPEAFCCIQAAFTEFCNLGRVFPTQAHQKVCMRCFPFRCYCCSSFYLCWDQCFFVIALFLKPLRVCWV